LTGDRQHKDHISTGHLSRHSNRPNVFYFFSTAHFLKPFLKDSHRTQAHPPLYQRTSGFIEKNGQTTVLNFNFDNWKIEVINDDKNGNKTVSI